MSSTVPASANDSITNAAVIALNGSPSSNGAVSFDDRNSSSSSYDDYHTRLVARLKKEYEERRTREREAEERLLNGKRVYVVPVQQNKNNGNGIKLLSWKKTQSSKCKL